VIVRVTTLGSAKGDAVGAANAVVRYLDGRHPLPRTAEKPGQLPDLPTLDGSGIVGYYADSVEGPGRWLGRGITGMRLEGQVDPEAFRRVLLGQHALTGEQLVGARGSALRAEQAGREGALVVAAGGGGDELLSLPQAAALLGVSDRYLRKVAADTTAHQAEQARAVAAGEVPPETPSTYLVATQDGEGTRWQVARSELERFAGRPLTVAASGEPDELLSLPQAAALLGVSDRYLRKVAADTTAHQAEQARAVAAGEVPPETPSTYLVATLDDTGRRWQVARSEVERFALERRVPAAVVGYDLTFSAPKSVSILWARADAAGQAKIVAAIDKAVAVGMAYMQEQAAWVGRGNNRSRAPGLVAADYVHATSRALDPQLHHHVVVANMAESPTGSVVALDGRPLYAHAKTAGYLAAAELRHELSSTMGVAWEQVERGLADVAGVGGVAISEMSQRSAEIEEYVGQARHDSLVARQAANFATRATKDHAVDPDALRPSWQARLDAAGFDARAAAAVYGRQAAPLLVTNEDRAKLFRRLGGARGVTEMASTFDRRDVIQHVAEWAGDRLDATQITDLADEWLTTEAVVTLEGGRREGRTADVIRLGDGRVVSSVPDDALYTTRTVLAIEQRLFASYGRGRHAGAAVVPEATVEAVLASRSRLGDDQAEMVRAITRSGHRVQCVLGPAGAGKTTALEAAVRAWEQAGFTPIGTAVQGTHAEVLGARTGIEARTVASLLMAVHKGSLKIGPQSVILVDESSTLGNRDLLDLMVIVEDRGGALRLIGDPAQHSAVAAGGAWRRLLEEFPHDRGEVTELRRQRGEEMADVRLALTDYREDRVAAAVERLREGGRVVEADSPEEVIDALVADWYHDRQLRIAEPTREASSMTADHHHERRELNHRARALLAADGSLTGPSLDLPGISFRAGDEVIATQGHKDLRPAGGTYKDQVKTGERGTVVAVRLGRKPTDSSLVVDFETRGRVVVDHHHLTHRVRPGIVGRLTHSYALTTYAAQGATMDAGRGLATEASARAGVYVALSRGVSDAKLYVLRRRELVADADDHPELPRLETTTAILAEVTARLQAQQAEQLATTVDPDAPQVARLRQAHSLGELAAMAAGPATPDSSRARRALVDELGAIASRARLRPDADLVARLGPRPAGGAHRKVWDAAVGEVATFRTRWGAEPLRGGPAASWALGPQRSGAAGADYATAAALLRRAEAAALALRPTAELAGQRRQLLDLLRASVGAPGAAPTAPDPAGAADALAAAVAAHRSAQHRLDRAEAARGRRRNPQSIELATQDVAAAALSVARAQAGFDQAVQAQSAQTGDPDGRLDAAERLATVEAALVLQADRAVETQAPYLSAVLGDRPDSRTDRAVWDAGANALERYRHVQLGLGPDMARAGDGRPPSADPFVAAVGPRPAVGAGPYDELVAAVRVARAELLLADLAREAAVAPYDASPAARLATIGRLPSLVDELARARTADSQRFVAERRVQTATTDLARAKAAAAEAAKPPAPPARRLGRSAPAVPDPAVVADAQRRLARAQAVADAAEAALAATPAPPAGQLSTLENAIILRERRVGADALETPPPWLRADVERRVAAHPAGDDALDPQRLATAYEGVAAYAERAGITDAQTIDDVLSPAAPTEDLARYRTAVVDDLDLGVDTGVEAGIDLGL
jgi:conjugative relaxase-like TrwC/TraI family protein